MAIAIVAVLAGSGLFLSGYTLGQRTASEPSTPISEADAFRPFWDTYHTITDTYAGGDVDRETLIQGAIKGMVGALGDPYSSYLTRAGVPREPPGDQRPVRGGRRGDRDAGQRRDAGLRAARAGLPSPGRQRLRGLAGREGGAPGRRPHPGHRRHDARRPDRRRRPRPGPRAEGLGRDPAGPARRRGAVRRGDHAGRRPAARGDLEGPRRRLRRVCPAERLLRRGGGDRARGRWPPTSRPGGPR